jgi:hypothetical protein
LSAPALLLLGAQGPVALGAKALAVRTREPAGAAVQDPEVLVNRAVGVHEGFLPTSRIAEGRARTSITREERPLLLVPEPLLPWSWPDDPGGKLGRDRCTKIGVEPTDSKPPRVLTMCPHCARG